MNVVFIPMGSNIGIKTLGYGSPYMVTGHAGTVIAAQYLVGTIVAGVLVLGGVVALTELMRSEYDTNSIKYKWREAGIQARGIPRAEHKSILQIWKEEGEKARAK